MSLFSKLFGHHKKGSKTAKTYSKEIPLYFIFERKYSNPDEYRKESPLYIAITPEEAVDACTRIAYLKNFSHYYMWAHVHAQKIGFNTESWYHYTATVLGGPDYFDQLLTVIAIHYTYQDVVSMLRTSLHCVCGLNLPGETPEETETFLMNNLEFDDTTHTMRSFKESKSSVFPADFFGTDNLAEFVARSYCFNEAAAKAAVKAQRLFLEMQFPELAKEDPQSAENMTQFYKEIERYVGRAIPDALSQQPEKAPEKVKDQPQQQS